MRYVTEIHDKSWSRTYDGYEYYLSENAGCHVTVYDTDSGCILKDFSGYDCIGRGLNFSEVKGVVVKHTLQTASLHRHVNVAETRVGVQPLKYKHADKFVLKSGLYVSRGDAYILDIVCADTLISVFGEDGSVVVWRERDWLEPIICTLYDLLVYLCQLSGKNIMQYETLQLGSDARPYRTTIRLLHDKESEVFYTKMMLDVGHSALWRKLDAVRK